MSITLGSTGGGSVTLQEPTTASSQTLTLPDVTGTVAHVVSNALPAYNGSALTGVSAWTPIGTYTANNSTTLDVTNLGSYKALRITFYDVVPATDGTDLFLRLSSDNGATFITTGYNFIEQSEIAAPALLTTDNFEIASNIGNVTTDGPSAGQVFLGNFSLARRTTISSESVNGDSAAAEEDQTTKGFNTSSTAMNAIRLYCAVGNISTGTFVVEGLTQ